MTLSPGTNLGPYEILASIGAGGMGEVYRARDAKLKRDVAIKVLPAALARDPDRLEAGNSTYVPSPDGQRFLVVVPAGGDAAQAPSLTVITHWQTQLRK